jgi:hypothetical protein
MALGSLASSDVPIIQGCTLPENSTLKNESETARQEDIETRKKKRLTFVVITWLLPSVFYFFAPIRNPACHFNGPLKSFYLKELNCMNSETDKPQKRAHHLHQERRRSLRQDFSAEAGLRLQRF